MAHSYHEIVFTPTVRAYQQAAGSRAGYAAMSEGGRYADQLTEREATFISQRDSFYMASVSETGWPYVQHRGGPAGFMKIIDACTIGFADYSGNRQYVSHGNFTNDDRVSLFFMDYPNQRRLKMMGRVRVVGPEAKDILEKLEDPDYAAQVERGFVITIEGFDWNCPAHITPRFTEAEVRETLDTLMAENRALTRALEGAAPAVSPVSESPRPLNKQPIGEGPLALVVTGVRQLTPEIRAYELRDPDGGELPVVTAGSHLRVPVRLADGQLVDRHYSIASNPARRDIYEIAVRLDPEGRGGSRALHASFELGTLIHTERPENHFPLCEASANSVLIAGGIGITAIKPMAQTLKARGEDYTVHYAGKSRPYLAYLDCLERRLENRLRVHSSDTGERMDLDAILCAAWPNTHFYICGPERLITDFLRRAKERAIPRECIHLERFS